MTGSFGDFAKAIRHLPGFDGQDATNAEGLYVIGLP
jgi:hypothetical protein